MRGEGFPCQGAQNRERAPGDTDQQVPVEGGDFKGIGRGFTDSWDVLYFKNSGEKTHQRIQFKALHVITINYTSIKNRLEKITINYF